GSARPAFWPAVERRLPGLHERHHGRLRRAARFLCHGVFSCVPPAQHGLSRRGHRPLGPRGRGAGRVPARAPGHGTGPARHDANAMIAYRDATRQVTTAAELGRLDALARARDTEDLLISAGELEQGITDAL